jgi:hypothetical protein
VRTGITSTHRIGRSEDNASASFHQVDHEALPNKLPGAPPPSSDKQIADAFTVPGTSGASQSPVPLAFDDDFVPENHLAVGLQPGYQAERGQSR